MRTKQNQALQELQDEMDSLKKAKSKYVPEAFRNNDEITCLLLRYFTNNEDKFLF